MWQPTLYRGTSKKWMRSPSTHWVHEGQGCREESIWHHQHGYNLNPLHLQFKQDAWNKGIKDDPCQCTECIHEAHLLSQSIQVKRCYRPCSSLGVHLMDKSQTANSKHTPITVKACQKKVWMDKDMMNKKMSLILILSKTPNALVVLLSSTWMPIASIW